MGMLALILGILGGLCGTMGILTAAEVVPLLPGVNFNNWLFWFGLAGVLLIGCIAAAVNRPRFEE